MNSPAQPLQTGLRSAARLRVSLRLLPRNHLAPSVEGKPLREWITEFVAGLPDFEGSPIRLQFFPELTAHRGKLLSAHPDRGRPVYAATFIPQRRIVLEQELLAEPILLRLILAHEILHFAWTRLGNVRRAGYQALLAAECASRARGELGESAALAKEGVAESDWHCGSLAWRYYACESFCDTGAWLLAGVTGHSWFRLGKQWRERRAEWFRALQCLRV